MTTCPQQYSEWRRVTNNSAIPIAGSIRYKLKEGGPVIEASDDGTTARETYIIRSTDVPTFYRISFPPPIFLNGRAVQLPRRRMPGAPFLMTKRVTFKPFTEAKPGDPLRVDTGAVAGTYSDWYEAEIEYASGAPEDYFERSFTSGAQFLAIPPSKTQLEGKDADGKGPDESATKEDSGYRRVTHSDGTQYCVDGYGMPSADLTLCPPESTPAESIKENQDKRSAIAWLFPTIEYTLKRKYVLDPGFNALFQSLGKVNSDPIRYFQWAKPETVLFSGISGYQTYVWDGATSYAQPWTVELKFTQQIKQDGRRTYGWNHVYNPESGEWEEISRPNGKPLYYRFNALGVLQSFFSAR